MQNKIKTAKNCSKNRKKSVQLSTQSSRWVRQVVRVDSVKIELLKGAGQLV